MFSVTLWVSLLPPYDAVIVTVLSVVTPAAVKRPLLSMVVADEFSLQATPLDKVQVPPSL